MYLNNATVEKSTETTSVDLTNLAGADTLTIPEGAFITSVKYIPAIAGDAGGFSITIDGSGTDIAIGTVSETQASQTDDNVVFMDGWVVGSGQAGVLTATASGSPTQGSGTLYCTFTRTLS
jgi:hypothetical protein